ncbi:unnamed protein product [Effrenium voratum]|nr:unnamed protein product [Effrenium voratum]
MEVLQDCQLRGRQVVLPGRARSRSRRRGRHGAQLEETGLDGRRSDVLTQMIPASLARPCPRPLPPLPMARPSASQPVRPSVKPSIAAHLQARSRSPQARQLPEGRW